MSFLRKIPGFRSGKKWKMVVAVIVYLIIIGGIHSALTGGSDSAPTTASSTADQTKTADKPKTSNPTPPPFDFSKADLTKDNVRKVLTDNNIISDKEITNVTVEQDQGQNIVNIFYKPESTWDENTFVQDCSNKAVDAMEIMFSNPKADKVWLWGQSEMEDAKGNSSVENVYNVSMTKENAKDINWKNFKDLVMGDYKNLAKVANSMFIAPGIAKNLK